MEKPEEEKKKIMVIDDNAFHHETITLILKDKYEVIPAMSGQAAIEMLLEGVDPDLILLDIVMPDMDGWVVHGRIKKLKPDTPVAFVSSVKGITEIFHSYSVGINDFITKPYIMEDLLQRIETMIANSNKASPGKSSREKKET